MYCLSKLKGIKSNIKTRVVEDMEGMKIRHQQQLVFIMNIWSIFGITLNDMSIHMCACACVCVCRKLTKCENMEKLPNQEEKKEVSSLKKQILV